MCPELLQRAHIPKPVLLEHYVGIATFLIAPQPYMQCLRTGGEEVEVLVAGATPGVPVGVHLCHAMSHTLFAEVSRVLYSSMISAWLNQGIHWYASSDRKSVV